MNKAVAALLALILLAVPAGAAGYRLKPWKDDLFKYPKVIETGSGGDYVKVEYVEQRDLYERDVVPEKKTKDEYVSLDVKSVEQDLVLSEGKVKVGFIAAGKVDGGAKAVVIYIHGRKGNRFQGANDWMFGGNFNRIKNLMVKNGGVYISPGFPDLGAKGKDQAQLIIDHYAKNSPGAPIFVACGSLGGKICWALAKDAEASKKISGMLLMGSTSDDGFLKSAAFKEKRFPIYFGHGTRDIVINWKSQLSFFQKIRKAAPDYPVKFALFDTGSHGTPIRMTDWRDTLNWMLER